MRAGSRLVFAALLAGGLAVSTPAAEAKSGVGPGGKKGTAPPKAPALTLDVARIEPLAVPGAPPPTVALEGTGGYRGALEIRPSPAKIGQDSKVGQDTKAAKGGKAAAPDGKAAVRTVAGVGAVNDVALEDYLKGISEVPSSWPPEVLRAQAIAARTYLLWVLGNAPAGSAAALGAQICATESCQVYSGVAKEQASNGASWAAAVRDTAGLALLSGGSPILAKYSACNGGRSVSGGKPYLKAIDDPDDARCPLHRWGLGLSYDEVGRSLAVPGTVKAVRATPGDVTVDWVGADGAGGRLTVPRTEFRAKVGAAVAPPPDRSRTVPSILFNLRPDDGGRMATLDGRGFGHGIGMGQWGAYGKALRGMRAEAILAAYYGGIQPAKVPAAKLPARVRVAVESGKPEAVVSASGPFRVLDSKGRVVVPVATGTWKIVPAAKGVRLLPPRDQAGAPGLSVLGIEPAAAVPGQPFVIRFKSNLPGYVSATAQPPGGAEGPVLAPQVAGTEEHRLTLPAAAQPGIYALTLTADSGPGRTATLTVTPVVVNLGPALADASDGATGKAEAKTAPGGLYQALAAGDRSAASRASRSTPIRPFGASPSGEVPGGSDRPGVGVLLAALSGFAIWRFRARTPSGVGAETLAVLDPAPSSELPDPLD
jgi:stage II sporulation protein D